MWSLIEEYKEEIFGCSNFGELSVESFGPMRCDDGFLLSTSANHDSAESLLFNEDDLFKKFRPDPYVSFMVKAISALTAAFRLVQVSFQQD